MRFLIPGLVIAGCLSAQAAKPEFDVASVKLSAPGPFHPLSWKGGPGTDDPGRISIENYPIESLILAAYDIQTYQVAGPSWLIDNFGPPKFDITATMPPTTTKEQFHQMLQNLLAERFKLAVHHELKDMQIDDLVLAKSGSKLKPSPQTPPAAATSPSGAPTRVVLGADGYPVLGPGVSMSAMDDRGRMRATNETMDEFAAWLSAQRNRPVTNATGLAGEYDFTLSWDYDEARAAASGEPTLTDVLQERLGLKLETRKGQTDVIVIDHVEKSPTEN